MPLFASLGLRLRPSASVRRSWHRVHWGIIRADSSANSTNAKSKLKLVGLPPPSLPPSVLTDNMRDMQSQQLSSRGRSVRPSGWLPGCQFGSRIMSISGLTVRVRPSVRIAAAAVAASKKCPWANSKLSGGRSTNPTEVSSGRGRASERAISPRRKAGAGGWHFPGSPRSPLAAPSPPSQA